MRTTPSHRSILYLVNEKSHNSSIEIPSIERSIQVIPLIAIGLMRPFTPRINRIFSTFEPNTLPMAMPELPLRAATMLVANSGIDA